MAKIDRIDVDRLGKTVEMDVEIVGLHKLRIRSIIGGYLVRLGLWIIGIEVNLKFKE